MIWFQIALKCSLKKNFKYKDWQHVKFSCIRPQFQLWKDTSRYWNDCKSKSITNTWQLWNDRVRKYRLVDERKTWAQTSAGSDFFCFENCNVFILDTNCAQARTHSANRKRWTGFGLMLEFFHLFRFIISGVKNPSAPKKMLICQHYFYVVVKHFTNISTCTELFAWKAVLLFKSACLFEQFTSEPKCTTMCDVLWRQIGKRLPLLTHNTFIFTHSLGNITMTLRAINTPKCKKKKLWAQHRVLSTRCCAHYSTWCLTSCKVVKKTGYFS